MPGKACQVIRRHVVAKIIEQEKGIEFRRVAEPERAPKMDARAFKRRLRLDKALDGPN
jgi:hypothetical protein